MEFCQVYVQQILKEYLELYGYWMLFIGTFLEGEAVLIFSGLFAFQGYMSLPVVILVASAGSFIGDQTYFYLGRYQGNNIIKRFRNIAKKFRQALKIIEKYGVYVAFISRFTYGFRIVLPIILGVTNLAPRTFLFINLASALLWSIIFSTAGFLFGKSASLFMDNISRYEPYLMLALLGLICLAWGVHAYHLWSLKKPARERLARMKKYKSSKKELS